MSETQRAVAYDDIIVGDDFNSRKSFQQFIRAAFTTDADGRAKLKSVEELAKCLDEAGNKTLSKLKELAKSIEAHGLLAPIVVRENGPVKAGGKRRYFLIAGERRYRAIGLIREENPAKFKQVEIKLIKCNASDSRVVNILENLQREELEPMEVARSIKELIDEGLTQAQIAAQIFKSVPYVSQHLTLLKAAPEVQAAVEAGSFSATHAREVSTLPAEKQKEVLKTVVDKKAKGEKVSVQSVKEEADKHKKALGIKQERERKPKEGDPVYDAEKIKVAKDAIGDRDIVVRSKKALFEQLGILIQRLSNPNISESTAVTTKAKIAAIEYTLGIRDSL